MTTQPLVRIKFHSKYAERNSILVIHFHSAIAYKRLINRGAVECKAKPLSKSDSEDAYVNIAHELMDSLSDVTLPLHPHFRIVPPARQESEPALWAIEGKNDIGYIFEDKNLHNSRYITKVQFVVKTGTDSYVEASILVDKSTNGKMNVVYQLKGSERSTIESDQKIVQLDIAVTGGEDARFVSVKILKDFKVTQSSRTIFFKLSNVTEMDRVREGQASFEFGNMLNFRVYESSDELILSDLDSIKGYGLLPVDFSRENKEIKFCDYFIGTIPIPKPRSGMENVSDLAARLDLQTQLKLDPTIVSYIQEKIESRGGRLYEFQARSIAAIGHQIRSNRDPSLVIARTAAGKTEAFLIPIVNWLLTLKRSSDP